MATTYEKCPEAVHAILRRIINQHHPDLKESGVRVDLLFAQSDKEGVSAVKLHGYPKAAKVRKTTLKERTLGHGDAEIIIDRDHWEKIGADTQNALIDHELEHLAVKRDQSNRLVCDDAERPVIGLRLHDWELGGFRSIVERHGPSAIEHNNAQAFFDQYGQMLFGFAKQTFADSVIEQGAKAFDVPKGIDSVTLSSGGKSVTLKRKKATV